MTLYLINGKSEFSGEKKFIDNRYTIDELGVKIFGEGGWNCIQKLKSATIDFQIGKSNYGYTQYKNMSKILSYMEVSIMKEIWRKLIKNKINYISLFDGVLVSSKDKELVLQLVNNNKDNINSCIKYK